MLHVQRIHSWLSGENTILQFLTVGYSLELNSVPPMNPAIYNWSTSQRISALFRAISSTIFYKLTARPEFYKCSEKFPYK